MEKKFEIIKTDAAREMSSIYDYKKSADEARMLLWSIGNIVNVDEDAQLKFLNSLDEGIDDLMSGLESLDKSQVFDTIVINHPSLDAVVMGFYNANLSNYLDSDNGLIMFSSQYIPKLKDRVFGYFEGSIEENSELKNLIDTLSEFEKIDDKENYTLIYY